ncbi:mitochondrial 18 KDa protein-domain-containing protein [Fimicolochytrium jonesii]|uniref:mitochondrial 18 KDa protein-domain-containing protein n=1 Tax=Fimicolochytrium jonesii TaxID=1396493 RepID=UPI0022FF2053|nr:mitochondrial 18 KDa protein-domain-containing protein [Fimicolochytrium jonesii]KAI8824111.1 mitochondrial 18 KDa protein-domain-containing protein [Fimicolochytrium jonesii]
MAKQSPSANVDTSKPVTEIVLDDLKADIAKYPATAVTPLQLIEHPQTAESTDTPLRFLAYAARFKTLAITGTRYLAYTSDVGEAFRPVVHKNLVNAAYGISFAYVGFDVALEGYKAAQRNADKMEIARVVAERGVFQGLASLLLPALTIHTVVDMTGKALKSRPKTAFVRWTPTVAGLFVVPFLPIMYDHPVEHLVAKAFDTVWPLERPVTLKDVKEKVKEKVQ